MNNNNIVDNFMNILNSFVSSGVDTLDIINETNGTNRINVTYTSQNAQNNQLDTIEDYSMSNNSILNNNITTISYSNDGEWKNKVTDPIIKTDNYSNTDDINNTKIEVIRYVVEYYTNKNNLIRWFAYFLPNKKLEIRIRSYNEYLSTEGKMFINVTATNYPKNLFKIDSTKNIYESKLEKVYVNKNWIDKCIEYYEISQKLKDLQVDVFINSPQDKTLYDNVNEIFEKGMKCFELNDYQKGKEEFLKCINILNDAKLKGYVTNKYDNSTYYLSYYNIACCYARENDNMNAIEWLKKSFENGYTNWSHAISDKDMRILLEEKEFIKLIKEMKKNNPTRDVTSQGVIKTINIIDIFLKKNKI